MHSLLAPMHHVSEQLHEQLAGEPAIIGLEPEGSLGIDRRSGADALSLTGAVDYWSLSARAPSLAMHRVRPKARLVPEEYFGTLFARLPGNGRVGLTLPAL